MWGWNRQSVAKRRHIKLWRRGIARKKEHNKRQFLTPAAFGTSARPIKFNSTTLFSLASSRNIKKRYFSKKKETMLNKAEVYKCYRCIQYHTSAYKIGFFRCHFHYLNNLYQFIMFFCHAGNSIIVRLWTYWIFPRDWWLYFHFPQECIFLILCSISNHSRYHKLFVLQMIDPTDLSIVVC